MTSVEDTFIGDLLDLLQYFAKNTYKARDTDPKVNLHIATLYFRSLVVNFPFEKYNFETFMFYFSGRSYSETMP